MPGKHDPAVDKEPPFHHSILTTNANKRLSFIDKGKSWARQLLKNNSNKTLNASQNSFESCDSGIDATTFIRGSFNAKNNNNNNNKFSSNHKMPQSSSCSFITSPYLSSSVSSSSNSTYNSTPIAESTLTTSKSTSFTSCEGSSSSYEQVYMSPSNSSASSSGYLMSPVDESGYLVPIITLTNRQASFNEKRKPSALISSKSRNKNRLSNLIPSCSPLTRSFSTRSAYNQSNNNNNTRLNSSYSHQYNPSNRATICEQINVSQCIKCNCKLNNLKASSYSDSKSSVGKMGSENKGNVQDLNKYNHDYNLFESHTCASCITSSDFNSSSSNNNNFCKPPIVPAPLPPVDLNQKPPQLPHSHPPRCFNINTTTTIANNKSASITTTSVPSNPPPPLPLLPPPPRQQQQSHQFLPNTNFQNSIYLLTPNPKSTENLDSFINLFEPLKNTRYPEKVAPLEVTCNRTKSASFQNPKRKINSAGNEIVYIDSGDLESSELGGVRSSSSVSLASSAESLNRYSVSSNNPGFDMNCLIAKLRCSNQNSQFPCPTPRPTLNSNDYNKLSYRQQPSNPPSNPAAQQHDYHVIDDIINETTTKRPPPPKLNSRLTPNNSLASFDFIDPNYTRLIKLDTTTTAKKGSYETSWENSTVILLDRLNEKLASSLIAIANEQKKELEEAGEVGKYSMRERKNEACQQGAHGKRISFPFRRACMQKSVSQTLNSSSSSGHHSFSSDHSPATSIPSNSGSSNELNSNSEDVEHLLTISSSANTTNTTTEDDSSLLAKSYTNSSNSTYQYAFTSEHMEPTYALVEAWYQPHLPRESVQECLADQEIGSFIIRLSNTCKNCYALSIRVPYFANQNGIAHYLITKNSRGFKLKGVEKEFKSLKSLVTHYSVMQEILPVTLNSLGLSLSGSSEASNQKSNSHEYSDQNNNMACIY